MNDPHSFRATSKVPEAVMPEKRLVVRQESTWRLPAANANAPAEYEAPSRREKKRPAIGQVPK